MEVARPVPEHEALLGELRLVREKGLRALRRLHLPALHQAAAALGVTTTEQQPEPAAIEELISKAVDRFGGDDYQKAAEYTFGLVRGSKLKPVGWRRDQAAKLWGVPAETFRKGHEKLILEQTAEGILALLHDASVRREDVSAANTATAQQLSGEPDLHDDVRRVPTSSSESGTAAHSARRQTANIERSPALQPSLKRAGRRGRVLSRLVAAALVLESVAGAVVITGHWPERTWNGMTASELERRYDGKLPWGDDDESRCADQPNQAQSQSQIVDPRNNPPAMGPDGTQVGTVQLRKSPICPTAIWARVLWNGDERSKYQIPPGWILHSVMHRSVTNSRIEELDPSTASQVPYIVSRMIASARGCVYAEVYFTKGDARTASARTSCVQA